MATIYYDRWGNLQGAIPSAPGRTLAYMVEEHAEANGVTVKYICYNNSDPRAIQRITKTKVGSVTTTKIENAFGAWEDRETLEYFPVNDPIIVSAPDEADDSEDEEA